jgi:GrpB-like predicted nucleotidyltransferase (UPF0157 family)
MSSGPSAVVVDHDERWAQDFEAIRARLWPAVAAVAVGIEHVGSTAVPGLAAKPIIDVDVVVPDAEGVPRAVAALERLGYEHRGDQGVPGREALSGGEGLPEHHLYVVVLGSRPYRDHVDLRDHLRRHPDAARRYAAEKRRLAHLLESDRNAYVDGKAWVVRELLGDSRKFSQPHG